MRNRSANPLIDLEKKPNFAENSDSETQALVLVDHFQPQPGAGVGPVLAARQRLLRLPISHHRLV